jgi:hypothetical protein
MSDGEVNAVTPIVCANPIEEAAQRYWRAAQIWRGPGSSEWTFGDMIAELRDLLKYRGQVAYQAEALLSSVVHGYPAETPITITLP